MDLLNGHIAAVPATEAAERLAPQVMTEQLCDKVQGDILAIFLFQRL